MSHILPIHEVRTNMELPIKIHVLHIPARGPLATIKCPSVRYQNIHHHQYSKGTQDLEARLGHVPDLRTFKAFINLKERCLLDKSQIVGAVRKGWEGDYYIYKCIGKTDMNLPKNENFKYADAYGDAFVFKLSQYERFDKSGNANFGNMDDFGRSLKVKGIAHTMVEEMMSW